MKQDTQLALKTGLNIFVVFFGAGSLTFPLHLGVKSVNGYPLAMIGYTISGILVTLLGMWVLVNHQGDTSKFLDLLPKWMSLSIIYIITGLFGVFGVIPRTLNISFGALSYFGISQVWNTLYTAIFLMLCFHLCYKENQTLDRLGKILSPVKVISLCLLLVLGLCVGKAENIGWRPSFFIDGIHEGYQMMDLLAVFFLMKFFYAHVEKRTDDPQKVMKKASIIGVFILGLMYMGFIKLGSMYAKELLNTEMTTLLPSLAKRILGEIGEVFISVLLILSSLISTVALVSTFSAFLKNELIRHYSYKTCVLITCAGSWMMSQLGFMTIYTFLGMVVSYIYPVLIIYCLLKFFSHLKERRNTHA